MRACPPPGRGRGTGPDGDKFRRGGTQETLGGAEAKRSPEEGLCPVLAKRPDIKKKPAKNLFLVGLLFYLMGDKTTSSFGHQAIYKHNSNPNWTYCSNQSSGCEEMVLRR